MSINIYGNYAIKQLHITFPNMGDRKNNRGGNIMKYQKCNNENNST